MRHSISSLLRLTTAPMAIASLLAIGLPVQPASAKQSNDYQTCAAALRNSGITEAQVASGCSAALRPAELATCVSTIAGQTAIEGAAALSGCRQVRRPLELSTCVTSINPGEGAVATAVLDNCRRSLLPVRFSECVVGLVNEISYNTNRAMRSCIAATDPEQDSLPTLPDGSAPLPDSTAPTPRDSSAPMPGDSTAPTPGAASPEPITPQVSPSSAPLPAPSTPTQP